MGIRKWLDDGFEISLFEAAIRNLYASNNPLRLNNFCYALRELISHVQHRTSPNSEIQKCVWFAPSANSKNGITRNDRAKYLIQGGLSDNFVQIDLGINTGPVISALIREANKLSKFTHIRPSTFNLPKSVVRRESRLAVRALHHYLNLVYKQREELTELLWNNIDDSIVNAAIAETIMSVDELVSHHSIDDIETEEIEINSINGEYVEFKAYGNIYCTLQWGSNSDVRRGDGLELPMSFPYTCRLKSPVADPYDIETDSSCLHVDTSSWRK